MQIIDIEIDERGDVTVGVTGVKGTECEALTKAIEEALGDTVERKRTAEFAQRSATNVRKAGA